MSRKLKVRIYLLALFTSLGIIIFLYRNDLEELVRLYSSTKEMEAFIKSYGNLGMMIFVFFQILQVIIFFIPGEFMQAVGGYLFHTIPGTMLSLIGILMGSGITFLAARRFGDELLKRILRKKDYSKIKSLICRPRNKLIIFILYLLPGFPKDALGYVSGITAIPFRDFLVLSTLARLPGIIVTSYLGSNLYDENYLIAVYITIGIAILLLIGIINRERILRYFK